MVSPDVRLPFIETPLIKSYYLKEHTNGANVHLKLELVQPSGSFKSRGLGYLVHQTVKSNPSTKFHFFSPSGGNAGCATAYAASMYEQECTVCLPTTANPKMVDRINKSGARVIVHGETIAQADKYLQTVLIPEAKKSSHAVPVYCHPYNDPLVWEGNSTLATELIKQMDEDSKPDAVICSVGGGGLYNGLVQGFEKFGWHDVPIIAVETEGVATLNQSLALGKQVNLENPLSIATSLSTRNVTEQTIHFAKNVHPTHSVVVSDADAAEACIKFAADHKLIIEAACGTALAPIYKHRLKDLIPNLGPSSNIVVIVCGGSSVDWSVLQGYSRKYGIPL